MKTIGKERKKEKEQEKGRIGERKGVRKKGKIWKSKKVIKIEKEKKRSLGEIQTLNNLLTRLLLYHNGTVVASAVKTSQKS